MSILDKILKGVVRLVHSSGMVCVIFLLALLGLMTFSILSRFVGYPITGAIEISGFLMVLISFLGFGYTLLTGGHVTVNMLPNRLRPKQRQLLETVTSSIGLAFFCFFLFYTAKDTYWSYSAGTSSWELIGFPIWTIQIFMPVGVLLMVLAIIAHMRHIWTGENNGKQE